jgi:hypothetical protein
MQADEAVLCEADASATGLKGVGFTRRNVRAQRVLVEKPPKWTY